jgi:hypothetical protein
VNNYSIIADFLNKFSQLTPWVQAVLGAVIGGAFAAFGYFLKEIVRVLVERAKGRAHAGVARGA